MYFQPPQPVSAIMQPKRTAIVTTDEVQRWISRELQAITLEEEVKVLTQVVLGSLYAPSAPVNTGRRYFDLDIQIPAYILSQLHSCMNLTEIIHHNERCETDSIKHTPRCTMDSFKATLITCDSIV